LDTDFFPPKFRNTMHDADHADADDDDTEPSADDGEDSDDDIREAA